MYARAGRSAYKSTLPFGSQKMSKIQDPRTSRPLRGVTIMRYINLHFTYLLTYLLTYLYTVL